MSKIEIFLTICACVAPVAALIFVIPKGFKFKKKEKPNIKTAEEAKETFNYLPETKEDVEVKEEKIKPFEDVKYSTDEFKDYLNLKNEKISKPFPKFADPDLGMPFEDFNFKRKHQEEEAKSIPEQINGLSPELKAMLIAGVLDKKKYD